MQSISWKSLHSTKPGLRAGVGSPRNTLAEYVGEYRKAMQAAQKVDRMAGHLDRAALLIRGDYSRREQ